MTGYTQPRIFRADEQDKFSEFLGEVLETPFEDNFQNELDKLTATVQVISDLLSPFAKTAEHEVRLSSKGIARAFYETGSLNGFMTFSTPFIIPENNFIYPDQSQSFADADFGPYKTRHLKPDRYKRMFWTSAFGLLCAKDKDPEKSQNSYIFPSNSMPEDFLAIEGIDPVIEAAAKLSSLSNHDYFHQIIYPAISSSFGHRDEEAPLNKHMSKRAQKLERAWRHQKLDRHFKVNAGAIEPWAMRFHAEVMQKMVEDDNNPIKAAVDELCEAIGNCPALLHAKGVMGSPPISAQDFATRLLAFNLVRMAPKDHAFTQECMDKVKNALNNGSNPDSKGVDAIFDHMYASDYTKVLFGDGNYEWDSQSKCQSAEEYSRKILELSAHGIMLAQRDCERATAFSVIMNALLRMTTQ